MKVIEKKLRELMRATEWNQQEVAEEFGVSQSTVNRWLKGAEPEGARRDAILAAHMRLVESGSTTQQSWRKVPVKGYIGAGQTIEAVDAGELDDVDAPSDAKPNTVAAIVKGDSMLPLFHENWVVYWSEALPPEAMVNQLGVVQLSDGRILVKTLRLGSQHGLWTLTSFNAGDIVDVPVDWVAKIDWIKPR